MTNFDAYSRVIFDAFSFNPRQDDLISKKYSLLNEIFDHYRVAPRRILFVGFNPAAFGKSVGVETFTLTDIDFGSLEGSWHRPITSLAQLTDKVDAVVAWDEFFTFLPDETTQRNYLAQFRSISRGPVVTSLRDYKNQDFRDREFSFPSIIKNQNTHRIYLEYHEHSGSLRNDWNTTVYEINNEQSLVHGPFLRHSVYFKQLAKFATDAGFSEFCIHKNLMYKSPIRKNYEHVISFA